MKYTSIEEQVHYGLEKVDPAEKVEIGLKDLLFIYKTMGELTRFFHQSEHYQTIEEVAQFLGSGKKGAFSLMSKAYYDILPQYLPARIKDAFDSEEDVYNHPRPPYYYKPKKKQG